jgi:hypothetical protein
MRSWTLGSVTPQLVVGAITFDPQVSGKGFWAELRGYEWSSTVLGIGLMNLGWLALLIPAVRRRWSESGIDRRLVRLVVGVAVAALTLWAMVMFIPYDTWIHQGSYLTMMLLMVSFAAMLATWPRWFLAPVLVLQFAYFGFVWIGSYYVDGVTHRFSHTATGLMLLAFAGLAGVLWRLIRPPTERPSSQAHPSSRSSRVRGTERAARLQPHGRPVRVDDAHPLRDRESAESDGDDVDAGVPPRGRR